MTIESQFMTLKQAADAIGCSVNLLRAAKASSYALKFPKKHMFKGRLRHIYYRRCEFMQWAKNEKPKEKSIYFYRYGGPEETEVKNEVDTVKIIDRSIEHSFIFGKRPSHFSGKGKSKCIHVPEHNPEETRCYGNIELFKSNNSPSVIMMKGYNDASY